MTILGISCWYHDAAACVVRDGEIVAAAQEERFTRIKHDPSFPVHAIRYCLAEAGIDATGLDTVAFYDKPFLKFERLLETYVSYAPKGLPSFIKSMPVWLKEKLWIPDLIRREVGFDGPLVFPEHHLSHAASAFYPSPFESAAVLTTDGVGEWATTSIGVGRGADLEILAEQQFPHSLGLLYSAFTYFCGFRVNSGEYKLMGLAPYGKPVYAQTILDELVDVREDGSFRLNMRYFPYPAGLTMTGRRFAELFGGPERRAEGALTQREMDLAASIQVVTEEVVMRMARHLHARTGERNCCLAGGVALNCVANGRLMREGPFDHVWIQPAAGDAGGALGAALVACHQHAEVRRPSPTGDAMKGGYLGPRFEARDIEQALTEAGLPIREVGEELLPYRVAELLSEGRVVGWFQGRMEFGPRALGARSILADPRGRDVQRRVNLKIKFRESFRPFAPAVLADRAGDWFEIDRPSPYMLLVAPVRNVHVEGDGLERLARIESAIPAVTHVDGSARIQTVHPDTNPTFHRLLECFGDRTGCPVLVNTSFNVRGEPIVGSPADAILCFRRTHMDALAIGPYLLTRDDLPDGEQTIMDAEAVAAEFGLD